MNTDFSIVRDRRLMIALSGGADSVALTVLLAQARNVYDLRSPPPTWITAYARRARRTRHSAARFAKRWTSPSIPGASTFPPEAAQKGGTGNLARKIRHDWLDRLKAEASCGLIALAHHMDDQAENRVDASDRGAGPEGLCGMRALSGDLYRPLLDLRKAELIEFLARAWP